MARALTDILTELRSADQPQIDQYNKQIQAVDPAQQAEEQGLQQAKQDAFAQIDQTANRRGMFYSGLPIAEEQKYTGANFLPSLANLRSKYAQQKFDLTNALNKISQDEMSQAQGIRQNELDLEEKQREFDAQMAAAKAAGAAGSGGASPSFDLSGLGGATGGYGMAKKSGGGFNFVDPYGNPVSAATYAAATGQPFRSVLQYMANNGDRGAATALNFVGNDYGYDPTKIGGNAGLYNALVWGTGRGVAANSPILSTVQARPMTINPHAPGLSY